MNNPVLFSKLVNYDNESFPLFKIYIDATSRTFENSIVEFETCAKDLMELANLQYDFEWLAEQAETFETTRREFKFLCDDVCILLGNRLVEACRHSSQPIVTTVKIDLDKPTATSTDLVMYGITSTPPSYIWYDGDYYNVLNTRLDENSKFNYYQLFISELDLR